ncbi:MAG: hypothetical protein MK434_04590 [SAR324 cluster bacterium]|nr:hypothetical protein [SAR324 cluster bacterium]
MPDSSFLSLVALGGAALFGLHGAVGLAIKHHFFRNNHLNSTCDKAAISKEAYTSIFPAACAAVIFYCMVLFILIRGIYQDEIHILLLNAAMIMALLATCYYAFKMFFRLRVICIGCIRVHLANLMMSSALLYYNFH